jgi:hypothetical protein
MRLQPPRALQVRFRAGLRNRVLFLADQRMLGGAEQRAKS